MNKNITTYQLTNIQNVGVVVKRWLHVCVIASVLATIVAQPSIVFAQTAEIITEPPSVEELADILFPPRTRSIVIGQKQEASSNGIGATGIAAMLIEFKFGKTDIVLASQPYLDALGRLLSQDHYANESLIIEGHTDAVGSQVYNQKLSEKRALAVRRYLVSRFDIDASRLHPVGKGESELYNKSNPKAAVNRRVQFQALDR